MKAVEVIAPAKLNLTLDITGLAENGYHEVDMVMHAVDLFDKITIRKSDAISLTCTNLALPTGNENLAVRAALAFFAFSGVQPGCAIHIEKRIPVGAGMAGGSADAAGVLVGLNELFETGFSPEQLAAIGAPLGADVPFAVLGGCARLTGIGTEYAALPQLKDAFFTVCMPPAVALTQAVYAQYDATGSSVRPDNTAAINALNSGDTPALAKAMANALQEANGGKHTRPVCDILLKSGALAAQMTGSGAALFGLFTERKLAENAMGELWQAGYTSSFFLQPIGHGAVVIAQSEE